MIGTEYLNWMQSNFRSKVIPCKAYGGQSYCGTDYPFTEDRSFLLLVLFNHSSMLIFILPRQTCKSYEPSKNNALSEIGEHWTDMYTNFFLPFFPQDESVFHSTSVINIYHS
jgi:hypothetical protein